MKPNNNLIKYVTIAFTAAFLALGFQNNISAQQKTDQKPAKKTEKKEKIDPNKDADGWNVRDYQPYVKAIKDLQKLNKEYSENLLKLAVDEYSTGLDIIEDMENEVTKMRNANKDKIYLNERWYWQEIDRKNQEVRQIKKKKYGAKMKAITYFTKSINFLDQVQSVEIRKDSKFINFQSKLFKMYVSTNYDLHNFKPCIPILERFLTLSENNKKDVWAYKYLASCYGYMEAVLTKYKHATEDDITLYKSKKNRSMLQAVELKYGVESPHYKHLRETVEIDEKKSERINDFK